MESKTSTTDSEVTDRRMEDCISEVEKQIENGHLFLHTVLSKYAVHQNEMESFLYGMVDLLIEKGLLSQEELQAKVAQVRAEIIQKGEAIHPGVALRKEKPDHAKDPPSPVNCAERLHICKAACCKLNFALSPREVESGKIKWDLGQPYHIRTGNKGYCTHLDENRCVCTIYSDRPKVCQTYSCANDKRIWLDFEKMEINQPWIDEQLQPHRRRLNFAQMDISAE